MPLYPEARIHPERRKSVAAGHPWIFSGALTSPPQVPDGSLVSVMCGTEKLGVGYYNSLTDIAVRLLSRKDEIVDKNFFVHKFSRLKKDREAWLPENTNAYRAVFAEADGCPGLIVDHYAGVLVAQFHTLGMECLRKTIITALQEVFSPTAIVERSDLAVRKHEGLSDQPIRVLHGTVESEIEIQENGCRFLVDVMKGQKTGFFLDQRENRLALRRWCAGRSVLNVFCYTGGFSVYTASVAKRVVSLDASASAMDLCRRNLALNGFQFPDEDFTTHDAFDVLSNLKSGEFDCIILDPPSFAKNRAQVANAIKAYTTINTKALLALPDGGILVSASCTSHIDPLTFLKILHQSSVNARCTLKVLEIKEQPFDHPYNLAFPEGRYLKFVVMQKNG